MSKNITIAEGGQAKAFTNVSHLKTNLIGGGTQYWVPEDEAGEYANVDEITITENGTYFARDEDLDGFSTVRVNVPTGGGGGTLITKEITENGTYYASDDGADGYSQVTVRGVGEATGINPSDGNEYHVETNPTTGEIVETVLPSSIQIITLPTKMHYIEGENIVLTGAVVKAYKNDGTIWESTGYSGGVIPISELVIEPTKAYIDESYNKKTDGNGLNIIEVIYEIAKFNPFYTGEEYHLRYAANSNLGLYNGNQASIGSTEDGASGKNATLYLTMYDGKMYAYRKSGNTDRMEPIYIDPSTGYWNWVYSGGQSSVLERWVENTGATEDHGINWNNIPISTVDPLQSESSSFHSMGCDVTVKWNRPKDSKTLRVTYGVTVDSAT